MAEDTEPETSSMESAAKKVRDAALWLIGAFGAIGAVLVAGLQLKDLGTLSGVSQGIAVGGAVVALAGLGVAVLALSGILLPHATTITELENSTDRDIEAARSFLNDNPEMMPGFENVAELYTSLDYDLAAYRSAFRNWHNNPAVDTVTELNKRVALMKRSQAVSVAATDWANYIGLRTRYKRRLFRGVMPGAIAFVVGVGAFAIAAAEPPQPVTSGLSGASLVGADLQRANLEGADMSETDLSDANLSFANLSGADLSDANMGGADLTGANLEGATMATANIEGVTWSGTTCPDGKSSDEAGGSCASHLGAPKEESGTEE